jgi:hypothetical protein
LGLSSGNLHLPYPIPIELKDDANMSLLLPFWQRLLITIAAMLLVSYLAGWAWQASLNFAMPSYAAGTVGGLVAVPIWVFLKRVRPASG